VHWNKQKLTSSPIRVLLDECVPRGLRAELPGHAVKTVAEAGWAGAKNGTLELAATQFDALLTVDRNLEYQQSFLGLTIAVIVVDVPSSDIAVLRSLMPAVLKALPNSKPGTVTHVHG
jgi:hypothetical protein